MIFGQFLYSKGTVVFFVVWQKIVIAEHIFRAYDIRGVYGVDLNEEAASRIGRSLATYLDGGGKDVIAARDVRLSGQALEDALIGGLLSGGCNVEEAGVVTTPILYFCTVHYRKHGGVMVTASHNPREWNGFKILTKEGFVCEGKGMETLKKIALTGQFKDLSPGKVRKNAHVLSDYSEHVTKGIHLERRLKAVLDPGNGSCSLLIPGLYSNVGMSVVALNSEPDGNFPAHSPDPTNEVLAQLAEVVLLSLIHI